MSLPKRRGPTPARRGARRWLAMSAIVVVVFGSIRAFAAWAEDRAPSPSAWHTILELRGMSIPELTLSDGQPVNLADSKGPHVLYLFRRDCPTCEIEKTSMAALLGGVSREQVLSGTWEGTSSDGLEDYWRDIDAPLPAPIRLDSAALERAGLARAPLMLFISPKGRIASAVEGSLLSWSPQVVRNHLRRAELFTP